MKIHDISTPISSDMPVFQGDKPVAVDPKVRISKGGLYNISRLTMSSHTGTHVDPPYHFVDGAPTIDQIPLEPFIGPCWVADMGEAKLITAETLDEAGIPPGTERLLLKTTNSHMQQTEFSTNFVSLDPSGASWCRDHKLLLLGIDYMSVGPFDEPVETHQILLGAGIVVVEWVQLAHIAPGPYKLICLPLLIKDGDGAPARAVLIEE